MKTQNFKIEESSFRDNQGNVYYHDNKVIRTVNILGKKNFDFIKDSEILKESILKKFLIKTEIIDKKKLPEFFSKFDYILESKKIPYISYPYEWTFEQLKCAAIHHLKFQIFLINRGAVLRDASAYNIQFVGCEPYFIDVLSIKKYEEGEYWIGYKQFCENFLNPLLLGSLRGINHNKWFRGALEGIETIELNRLLKFSDKFSLNIFTHVCLQAKLNIKSISDPEKVDSKFKKLKKLPKNSYIAILIQLKNWISKLKFKNEKTIWQNYSNNNTYCFEKKKSKELIVENFIKKHNPETVIDLGCNTGEYSKLCIKNGTKTVVGFDFDYNAIEKAFIEAKKDKLNFLPLIFDASNPSPNQGWKQTERKGFLQRFKSDALLALAFEHHMIIGKNIPIVQFVEWILNISNIGLLEFVPKSDKTVKQMLAYREDIFNDYSEKNFEHLLGQRAKIINKVKILDSERVIYEFQTL
ncbi:class I SAM-dependent methyltransferase [Candidatus Pelagibacter sp.]|nr:class I SAM-dependent methyltransferase [Candidatus Pelagibacter sp.]